MRTLFRVRTFLCLEREPYFGVIAYLVAEVEHQQDAAGEQVRLSDHGAEYHVLVSAVEAVHHEVNDVVLRYLERLALEGAQAVAQALQLLVYLAVFGRANVDSLTICGMPPSTSMPPHEYMLV